jgi:hypothetical protein
VSQTCGHCIGLFPLIANDLQSLVFFSFVLFGERDSASCVSVECLKNDLVPFEFNQLE